jgi:hypothetical protein
MSETYPPGLDRYLTTRRAYARQYDGFMLPNEDFERPSQRVSIGNVVSHGRTYVPVV